MSTPHSSMEQGSTRRREIWRHAFPVAGTGADTGREVEAQGFDGLAMAESQNLVGDPYVALALAAKVTKRIRLATGNTNPITRHPAVTASSIATVHVESGGRAVLGIARGDSAVAWIGRGPMPVEQFEPALAALQRYLRGEDVQIGAMDSSIPWIARSKLPKVEMDVAATGPRTIAAGARNADRVSFTLGADRARLEHAIQVARQARTAAGLDPAAISLGAYVNVATHPDRAIARNLVRGSAGIFVHFLRYTKSLGTSLSSEDRVAIDRVDRSYDEKRHGLLTASQSATLDDAFLDRFAVAGPSQYCVDRLLELLELGLDRLVIVPGSRDADPALLRETSERFSREVLPALRGG